MKTFIAFIAISIGLLTYGIYNKEQLNIWFGMNDHQQVANQFWFTQKNTLDETGSTELPFTNNVSVFDYALQNPTHQQGKYYFETTLLINNQYALPIYTVVHAIDGNWKVDVEATFGSTGDASLNFYIERYLLTLDNAGKFIKNGTRKIDKKEIDIQLNMIRSMFNDKYIQ